MTIGSRYTVRGFDGETILAAARGLYWRNELQMPNGVIVQADLSNADMASIAARIWGKPNRQNFNAISFQNSGGQIFKFNRLIGGK
ncbi:hypothetical protein Bamb_3780 [Burkholderia ambifaria AMMD]|uniref:Haemolysin activator HlyB C-terminal domain-containing protein n=1 Tax=Burkholderia ambifaria (strain ATCC BAA-244 / DSM 16087 / CCUG 44356 / LMG 19182 / AMMD) TaxID=339670 RepID=Q0B939_BURCM|nr:hypothetical protein Bamb_3780 [Burkholderia ambifaria AMMD]